MKKSIPQFSLSTIAEPAAIFEIDGDQYALYGLRGLNRETEAKLHWLFRRHMRVASELQSVEHEAKAMELALALRDIEVEVITSMTNVPRELAERLGLEARAILFNYLGQHLQNQIGGAGGGGA